MIELRPTGNEEGGGPMKKVAVIMPCHNAEAYVARTIESVLAQGFKDYHFIAANDGSSDDSARILNSYADTITLCDHADHGNHGQAATYNICLKHAKSEYIAFIDSDDLWHPDKLQAQVDVLDRNPDIGLVYTNGTVIDEKDKVLHPLFPDNHVETNRAEDILLNCYIRTPSSVMLRSSVLSSAGKFTEGIVPDHDMWIRIKELSNFYYIKDKLIGYRFHEKQYSQTSAIGMWRDGFGTLERAINRFAYPSYVRRKRLAVIHYRIAQLNLKQKRMHAAYHFMCACIYDPLRAFAVLKGRVH